MSNIHEVNVANENLYLELWQYDAGQILKFVETTIADGSHVLFANSETRKAIRKEVANNQVGIPNKFLRATGRIHITIEDFNENEETTLYEINGYIKRRQDGEPGTAPDDEPTFIQKIIQAIKNLQEAVANKADKSNTYTKDEVDIELGKKENSFTVQGHLSKENNVVRTDACKVYEYQYTFDKSAYPGIQEKDLIYNYSDFNAKFQSDIYFVTDVSGSKVQYREINGDAIRVFKSTNNPPTSSNDGYNPGDLWQKYKREHSGQYYLRELECVFMCIGSNSGLAPADHKWIKLIDDVYTTDEIDDLLLDFGNGISCSIDPLTFVCTFQLKNDNTVLSTASIDLPLETLVMDVDYDSQTKEIIITLKNGNTTRVDVSSLVSGLVNTETFNQAVDNLQNAIAAKQDKIDASHKISADHVDDSETTNKFVTTNEKQKWNNKSKIFDAVYSNGSLNVKTATYLNIKENDLIVCNDNNIDSGASNSYLKQVIAVDVGQSSDEIRLRDIKETYSIQDTPPTTAEVGADFIYQAGNILLSENGNIYVCASATYNDNTETFTYTWQTYNISGKQDVIDSNNKLDADLLDDSTSTKKLTTQAEKNGWDAKEDPTEIENDTTSTTVSLTLENNTENRYKEELTDLTIILPQTIDDDFISGVVFKSGSTPTTMTYDSSIKWTGEDVNNNVFVPAANKAYDFIIWNNGIYINAIVRGVS